MIVKDIIECFTLSKSDFSLIIVVRIIIKHKIVIGKRWKELMKDINKSLRCYKIYRLLFLYLESQKNTLM